MPPYYVVLTYGYNSATKECTHITMVAPDKDFKYSILTDALPISQSVIDVIPKEEQEDTIVSLNSQFESLVKLKEGK